MEKKSISEELADIHRHWCEFPGLKFMGMECGTTGHIYHPWYSTKTYFGLFNHSCTNIGVAINGVTLPDEITSVEILLRGNEELDDFIRALDLASRTLKKFREEYSER